MFLIPKEHVLFTSEVDVSQLSNRCYQQYDASVKNFLENYKILLRVLPCDIVREIMNHLDPRRSVHKFSGKIMKGNDCLVYDVCSKCFLKILLDKSASDFVH